MIRSYESARKGFRTSQGHSGTTIPDEALLAYYTEALGLPPSEIKALDAGELACLDAWAEGRMIARWWHESVHRESTQQPKQVT